MKSKASHHFRPTVSFSPPFINSNDVSAIAQSLEIAFKVIPMLSVWCIAGIGESIVKTIIYVFP